MLLLQLPVCGLLLSGGIRCWGRNDYGQVTSALVTVSAQYLGGTNTPSEPGGLSSMTFTSVVTGQAHSCALQSTTGNAWCWVGLPAGGLPPLSSVSG